MGHPVLSFADRHRPQSQDSPQGGQWGLPRRWRRRHAADDNGLPDVNHLANLAMDEWNFFNLKKKSTLRSTKVKAVVIHPSVNVFDYLKSDFVNLKRVDIRSTIIVLFQH